MKTNSTTILGRLQSGVTILELMVAVSLISFIILALYQMFDRTQSLMRGAVREADKFENGRAAMDILRRDLSQLGYVKQPFDSGTGAITNWTGISLPPTAYSAAATYPPGSTVRSGGTAYYAMATTTGVAPPSYPWTYAAPNFRVGGFLQVASPMNISLPGL
ncbi:MAG: prepilin-type N-terminal cleavage/methylation domain-containing protein [Proteobacteria bacterium]|nr:prepilin-type N-terminal cleavage/methylation domain-containing protein [Pseudomonadota bacterium]